MPPRLLTPSRIYNSRTRRQAQNPTEQATWLKMVLSYGKIEAVSIMTA
jgi:hypothetical protein